MIVKGDHVYFQTPKGPRSGEVKAVGKHGATVLCEGKHHKIKHAHVLGMKQKLERKFTVVDQGGDGALVEDSEGKQLYIHDSEGHLKQALSGDVTGHKKNDQQPQALTKSFNFQNKVILFLKAGPIKNRPGLSLQEVTDNQGHITHKWKRTREPVKAEREKRDPADKGHEQRGSKKGYGTHHMEAGDVIDFTVGQIKGSGKIIAAGKDGATVTDAHGHEHKVLWSEVTGHKPTKHKNIDSGSPQQSSPRAPQKAISQDAFKANEYFKQHNDASVTPEKILADFPADTSEKINQAKARLASIEQTIETYKKHGTYTEERTQLHIKIMDKFLSPDAVKAARPQPGEAKIFTILGGRGGSGKSWFKGKTYDPDKAIVLDADEIKGMLPEYEGWNAHQLHEESSDLFDQITRRATMLGLNIVHDATMKTGHKAVKIAQRFKDNGYQVEAHYMHLPRQEAAKRAVSRFLGKSGRYVPIEVVLSNVSNESSFDGVRELADKWSFYDNNVSKGHEPILISASENTLKKALTSVIIFRRKGVQ